MPEYQTFSCPFFIVGDSNTGKRTFAKSLSHNFQLNAQDDRFNIQVRSKLIISLIEDLPEQPFGLILVYDITNQISFDYIKNIVTNLPTSQIIILLGTHRDLQDQRQIEYEVAQDFKKLHNMIWFEFAADSQKQADILTKQIFIRSVFAIRNIIETGCIIPTLKETESNQYLQVCQINDQFVNEDEMMNLSAIIDEEQSGGVNMQSPDLHVFQESLSPQTLRQTYQVEADKFYISQKSQQKVFKKIEKLEREPPILQLDLELNGNIYKLEVRRDDVAYDLAKCFVERYSLDHSMIKQISLLVLDRLSQFSQQERESQLQRKKQVIDNYPFNEPKFFHKEVRKVLFKFELEVAAKSITVAWREGDESRRVAMGLIKTLGLKEELYYNFIIGKINEILSLWKLSQDE
ncbi:Ras domain-containing protein [Spironucleus salmonicida]|uniref:Ras domain-containing protein n=1 Tax=Spironucleus salmonicida TaxID=348837 RepID=V6LCN4_9EUKA|nr:Ras domain-containing protein [Spironucleus salmonicida]|eukprot:EST42207.1 Ras domain-containing protein [Spironucleus salmonicida]